ncbi:hypothetical protein [Bacillus sp. FJAT-50079]|uniref:hypothetical protein n=1 Tax=Bacillus sp. FJAT-50079 TaxID=2833577 RepID=UPI001BC9E077|nr:hypothetical protein [Bacillus sp. FJAT-50079]MBS4208448.1 hypothetical protein [Bacillus sp. FJAT-50079]
MTLGLYALCSILAICFVGVSLCIYRNHLSVMHGMVFAMAIAMVNGLFAGTLVGILFQGNLFLSTIIGISIGSSAGILIGSFHSIIVILEGALSGVMAGMMGAMLGEMVAATYWDVMMFIMFALALFVYLLIIIEVFKMGKNHKMK